MVLFSHLYPLTAWILERVASFPKPARFTIGERISLEALQLLEGIAEAQYVSEKLRLLERADRHLIRLRILLRLARDVRCLSPRQHEHVTEKLAEAGRMLGGWIAYERRSR